MKARKKEEKAISQKLNEFFKQYSRIKYRKHETILHPFDTPQGIFYLKKGYCRSFTLSKEGEELTLIIFRPGSIFPLRWAINDTQIKQGIESITEIEVIRAPREKFVDFLKKDQDLSFAFVKRSLRRAGELLERMEYLVFGNAYEKVASILVMLGTSFGEKKSDSVFIKVPFTHKDIASLVGLTRETASIELEMIKKKGFIDYKGKKIIIKDIEKLKEESLLG